MLFTLGMLVLIRVCAHIPVPGVNLDRLAEIFGAGFFEFFDIFAGGAFSKFAIVAMGVTPYINSSIIMQLLTVVIPRLEELQKEGEEGRKKIQQYTRYGAVVLGLVQAFGTGFALRSYGAFYNDSWTTLFVIMVSLTAGTALVMWIGEEITEKGIGNGISLIIFANIVSRLPYSIYGEILLLRAGQHQHLPASARGCGRPHHGGLRGHHQRSRAEDPGGVREARCRQAGGTADSGLTCPSASTRPA